MVQVDESILDFQIDRDSLLDLDMRRLKSKMTEEESKIALKFLENPIRVGFWKLKGDIKKNSGLAKTLRNYIETDFQNSIEKIKNEGLPPRTENHKILELNGKRRENILRISRFNFLFYLFSKLTPEISKKEDVILRDEVYLDFLSIINLKEIRTIYKDALDTFQEDLVCKDFKPRIDSNDLFRIKNGFIIITYKKDISRPLNREDPEYEFEFISLNQEPLKTFKLFLEKLDFTQNSKLEPVFSPEDELLRAFLSILRNIKIGNLTDNRNIQKLVIKALKECFDTEGDFYEGDFKSSIGSIGIAAEEILIQIYETYFRKPTPRPGTLGQIVDEIAKETQKIVSANRVREFNLQDSINSINSQITSGADSNSIIRNFLNVVLNLRKELVESDKKIIDLIESDYEFKNKLTVFPREIQGNLEDLAKYRNAISHKSRVFIGNYENSKAMFCLINLLRWWEEEKNKIDWSLDKEDIVKKSYEQNKFR